MSKETEKIEKLKEQIQDIIDSEKKVEPEEDGHVIIVDRKYAYDDVDDGTKVLDTLTDIEEIVEEKEEEKKEEEVPEEPKEEEIKEENPHKKKRKMIIIVSVVLFVLLLIIFLLILFWPKDKTKEVVEKEETLTSKEQKEILEDYGKELEKVISSYFEKQKVLLEYEDAHKLVKFDYEIKCKEHEIYKDGKVYLNDCKINQKKTKHSYGEKQEIIEDKDAIHVYVHKTTKKTVLKEPSDKEEYEDYPFHIDGKYHDLTLLSEQDGNYVFYYDENYHVQMKDFKKDEKVFSYIEYTSVLPLKNNGVFDLNYIGINQNGKWAIYNINTSQRITQHIYDSVGESLREGTTGPKLYMETVEAGKLAVMEEGKLGIIDYTTGKSIVPCKYMPLIRSGNYLWAKEGERIRVLDFYGKEYFKEYDEIYAVVEGKYVLGKKKNSIQLMGMDEKVIYDYGKVSVGDYNYFTNQEKIVFVFGKLNSKNGNECTKLIYDFNTKKGETKDELCGENH